MTLTQLEYIVALDTHRQFVEAAEQCFVTQPTLSMQVQKLEDALGVKIFDRTRHPIVPTPIGEKIIAQARVILREAKHVEQIILEQKNIMSGEIRIGIIPTLSPYLLPPLFKNMQERYPEVQLNVRETITEELIQEIKNNRLDCGIVVTPLNDPLIREEVLFYEELFAYVSPRNELHDKKYVLPAEIDPKKLWLLEEGHCFRSQVLNLCELRKQSDLQVRYETGNIETLRRMVDKSDGITLLPELAVLELSKMQMKSVRTLKEPTPTREVSLVMHRDYFQTQLLKSLKTEVIKVIPRHMLKMNKRKVIDITG
ncbi:MAG TPA: LysR substrate-binding domain-containing protein [Ferruginibacter sp.]|nr:LysR substrate-binding domain-containing protein [Ferruginibacter sp.]HRO16844.1 LysR substrate-binding domain-containing protein [Ferruginibacter sp.]HRQ20216.1 LysR substrate-binding domain-containing protein [Ferruginibacter sp.]